MGLLGIIDSTKLLDAHIRFTNRFLDASKVGSMNEPYSCRDRVERQGQIIRMREGTTDTTHDLCKIPEQDLYRS